MKKLLSRFNLGDTYEIQARVLPAMLVVLPVVVLVAQIGIAKRAWLTMIGWGAGLEMVLAVLTSKVGHALGVRLQRRLEMEWGGLPTHAWLRPGNGARSEQQRKAWWETLQAFTGLDIERASRENDAAEVDRVIADAVIAARNKLNGNKKAELVQKSNIAFGFARNLAGMKWLAFIVCGVCSGISGYGVYKWGFETPGVIFHLLFSTIAVIYICLADGYVHHCAIRYAEFFFAAVTSVVHPKKMGTR